MASEKSKDNRVTRFADEVLGDIIIAVNAIRSNARDKSSQAAILFAQAEVLEAQMQTIKESLAKGNYENGKTE